MKRCIDINCDIGEADDTAGMTIEAEMFHYISSANIACGGHAGDASSMERCVAAALDHRVAIGAHPGYPDRAMFGRIAMEMADAELEDSIARQIDGLLQVVSRLGGALHHVKPHGALYHRAMHDAEVAQCYARAVGSVASNAVLVGMAGAPALQIWRDLGWCVAAEAFADRRYEADGSLRDRRLDGAVITSPEAAAQQALDIARDQSVRLDNGDSLSIRADTICVHGDSPHALDIVRAIRARLSRAAFTIARPFGPVH